MTQTAPPRAAFRAGNAPGEQPELLGGAAAAAAVAPSIYLADVSEFQPDIADATYLAWSKAIVIRACYGDAHDDAAWYGGARRLALHQGGVRWLGIYQYLVAGQDAATQAGVFCKLLGKLQPGEVPICDLEEGVGSQAGRWRAWAAVVESELGMTPWLYSGLSFSQTAGIAPADWVAAYGSAEPALAHKLWQFTSAYPVPGVGSADCSVYHGTIDQLAATGYAATSAPASPAAFSATAAPPGRWAGTLTCSGTGTDGNPWHTTTTDGSTWTAPAAG